MIDGLIGIIIDNLDKIVQKFSVMDTLFGIAITCLIIGIALFLYYQKIEESWAKPFKLLLQFCTNIFLVFGLIGIVVVGGSHLFNKFLVDNPEPPKPIKKEDKKCRNRIY